MIIPIIEVIQTYLFVSCFLKRKVRFGKVLDWLVLIGVSEVGTIGQLLSGCEYKYIDCSDRNHHSFILF